MIYQLRPSYELALYRLFISLLPIGYGALSRQFLYFFHAVP
jgi:hypothetical protein